MLAATMSTTWSFRLQTAMAASTHRQIAVTVNDVIDKTAAGAAFKSRPSSAYEARPVTLADQLRHPAIITVAVTTGSRTCNQPCTIGGFKSHGMLSCVADGRPMQYSGLNASNWISVRYRQRSKLGQVPGGARRRKNCKERKAQITGSSANRNATMPLSRAVHTPF